MNCRRIQEILSTYIDNELPASEAHTVREHVAGCDRCAERLEALRGVVDRLHGLPRMSMSPDTERRLLAEVEAVASRLRDEPAPSRSWSEFLRRPALTYLTASAAALVIAVAVWTSGSLEKGGRRDTMSSPVPRESMKALEAAPASGTMGVQPSDAAGAPTVGPSALKRFTKEDVDALVRTSAPQSEDRAFGPVDDAGKAEGSPASSTTLLPKTAKQDSGFSLERAASVAAAGNAYTLVTGEKGRFDDREAWIVVIALEGRDRRVGAAIAIPDGRLLYRTP